MNLSGFWYGMINTVRTAAEGLVVLCGITGIFAVIFFSIFKIQNIKSKKQKETEEGKEPKRTRNPLYQSLAIAVSTVFCCFLMIPVVSAFNNLVTVKTEQAILAEETAGIRAAQAEVERRKAQNTRWMLERERLENRKKTIIQVVEIEALNDRIKLLEGAGMSMQSFRSILEVALLQTDIRETMFKKEYFPSPPNSSYREEMLAIITHDISAKFGIDLNAVKIIKLSSDTVIVSGLRSVFIGTTRNISDTIVSEIRRVNFDRNNEESGINVQNDGSSVNRATSLADSYKSEFQKKLSEGSELKYLDAAVVQLARNFLTVMLAPLYNNIRFSEWEQPGALPITAFLQKEIDDIQNLKIELMDIKDSPLLVLLPPEEDAGTPADFIREEPADGITDSVFDSTTLNLMEELLGKNTRALRFLFEAGEDGFYYRNMEMIPFGIEEYGIRNIYADHENVVYKTTWAATGSKGQTEAEYNSIISLLTEELGRPVEQIYTAVYWETGGVVVSVQLDGDEINVTVWIDSLQE